MQHQLIISLPLHEPHLTDLPLRDNTSLVQSVLFNEMVWISLILCIVDEEYFLRMLH